MKKDGLGYNVTAIVATDLDGGIARDGQIPWRSKGDMAWFRERTMGKVVVMGRKTYESIPADRDGVVLQGRIKLVITSLKSFSGAKHAVPFHGVKAEWHRLMNSPLITSIAHRSVTNGDKLPEVIIAGGEQVYQHFLSHCTRVLLTQFHVVVRCDKFFPHLTEHEWDKRPLATFPADADNEFARTVFEYTRKGGAR